MHRVSLRDRRADAQQLRRGRAERELESSLAPQQVAVDGVVDVDAHAAVQVLARSASPAAPATSIQYPRTSRSLLGVPAFGQPPYHRLRRQIDGARSDVDLRELRRHGLEGRQRFAELLPVRPRSRQSTAAPRPPARSA